ncbi:MAG TPA: RecX family transcriptional regulator [Anaerolineae bacterium]|nr:RecX family transcriptional regulator [Anaerolineae bacterium]
MAQQITAIRPQQKNKNRLSIFLDGEFAFGLTVDVAAPLQIGQTLTPEKIATLQHEEALATTRQLVWNYISYRPRSRYEVERHLHKKGIDAEIITTILDDLTARQHLDDYAFAQYWIEQREAFKPRSHLALRQELGQKRVAREIIDELLADVDETAAALHVGQKKARRWQNLPADQFKQKMIRFLGQRGFAYPLIQTILPQIMDTIEFPAEDNT